MVDRRVYVDPTVVGEVVYNRTPRTRLMSLRNEATASRAAVSKSVPRDAYRTLRDAFTTRPDLLELMPAVTAASTSPPWVPTPGTSKDMSPTTSRTSRSSPG